MKDERTTYTFLIGDSCLARENTKISWKLMKRTTMLVYLEWTLFMNFFKMKTLSEYCSQKRLLIWTCQKNYGSIWKSNWAYLPLRDVNALKTAVLEEWSLISQTVVNYVIASIKLNCDVCVLLRRHHIPYFICNAKFVFWTLFFNILLPFLWFHATNLNHIQCSWIPAIYEKNIHIKMNTFNY